MKNSTAWDGVRNYQARNYMRDQMRKNDLVFFYHSNAEPSGIAGIARVCKENYPDPTQYDKKSDYFDPKATKEIPIWFLVDVEFVQEFPVISLETLKKDPALKSLPLVQKGSRLSVLPISEEHWQHILKKYT